MSLASLSKTIYCPYYLRRSFTLFKNYSTIPSTVSDSNGFLKAMKNVPSSVVVVTTSNGDIKRGMTCSSFTSVSRAPPILSFCITQPSRMDNLLLETNKFVIHVLSKKQVHYSVHFSRMVADNYDQFEQIAHNISDNGCPLLPNCTSVIHCTAHSAHSIGDHRVWCGIVNSVTHSNQTPLIYYARSYRSVGDQCFMQSFETATLAYQDWTHEAHLRMAWNYLTDYNRDEATPLIKEGIKKYNKKHSDKITRGYHETITCFFIHMISVALSNSPESKADSFEVFLHLNQCLTDSQLLFNYYSKEAISTKDAKEIFIKPDIKSLP